MCDELRKSIPEIVMALGLGDNHSNSMNACFFRTLHLFVSLTRAAMRPKKQNPRQSTNDLPEHQHAASVRKFGLPKV